MKKRATQLDTEDGGAAGRKASVGEALQVEERTTMSVRNGWMAG